MMWPAVGMDTSTPSAISGSRPIVTNSVVPIANPPMASASTARVKCRAVVGRVSGAAVAVIVTPCSNRRPRTAYSATATSDVRTLSRLPGSSSTRTAPSASTCTSSRSAPTFRPRSENAPRAVLVRAGWVTCPPVASTTRPVTATRAASGAAADQACGRQAAG